MSLVYYFLGGHSFVLPWAPVLMSILQWCSQRRNLNAKASTLKAKAKAWTFEANAKAIGSETEAKDKALGEKRLEQKLRYAVHFIALHDW